MCNPKFLTSSTITLTNEAAASNATGVERSVPVANVSQQQCQNSSTGGSSSTVVEPRQFDILSGKTKRCVEHDGSRRFRAVIECFREQYFLALTKFDKTSVTRTIYETLSAAGSRFLKYDDALQAWVELSDAAARDKIGHALRFANRESRRKRSAADCSIDGSNSNTTISTTTTSNSSGGFGATNMSIFPVNQQLCPFPSVPAMAQSQTSLSVSTSAKPVAHRALVSLQRDETKSNNSEGTACTATQITPAVGYYKPVAATFASSVISSTPAAIELLSSTSSMPMDELLSDSSFSLVQAFLPLNRETSTTDINNNNADSFSDLHFDNEILSVLF